MNTTLFCYFLIFLLSGYAAQGQGLAKYQEIAATQNPELQAAYKAFEQALQRVAQAGHLPDPSISLGYFLSPVETRVGPQRWRLGLSQQFPWFGTLKAERSLAAEQAEAQYQVFLGRKKQVQYEVAQAYFPLYEQQALLRIEAQNLDLLSSYKQVAQARLARNQGRLSEVLRIELAEKEAQARRRILAQQEPSLLAAFNQLLHRKLSEPAVIPQNIGLPTPPPRLEADSLWKLQPSLTALQLRQQASATKQELASKQRKPSLGVGLSYIGVGPRSDASPADQGKDAFLPQVSLNIPIARKKYAAAEQEAQLEKAQYALQQESLKQKILTQYEQLYFQLAEQQELFTLYQRQVEQGQQLLEILFAEYSNGDSSFEEVIRLQQQILDYQKKQVRAKVRYRQALAELQYGIL